VKYLLLILFICTSNSLLCQDTSLIISKYKIVVSIHGNENLSKFDQDRQGYLIFHNDKFNDLNLTNISFDSGSYSTGRIYSVGDKTLTDSSIQSTYKWNFRNSYDKETGSVSIKLSEQKTNYGYNFEMILFLANNEKIIYKGFKVDESNQYIIPKTIF